MDQLRTPYARDYHNSPLFEQFGAPEPVKFKKEHRSTASEIYARSKQAQKNKDMVSDHDIAVELDVFSEKKASPCSKSGMYFHTEDGWFTANNIYNALVILLVILLIIGIIICIICMIRKCKYSHNSRGYSDSPCMYNSRAAYMV